MDADAIALIVVVALAVVVAAVVAVAIAMRAAGRTLDSPREAGAAEGTPRWYEILLAVALLLLLAVVIVSLVLSQYSPGGDSAPPSADWRTDSRSLMFLVIMVAAVVVGLLAYVIFVLARLPRPARGQAHALAGDGSAEPGHNNPAGAGLLGLVCLAVAFLLLGWIYVPRGQQYAMMVQLVYPASFAVALVLLFDKATRAWNVKSAGETVREWILCDGIAFLLFLGFLNLLHLDAADRYAGIFWDVLYVAGFFFTFWMLDRKRTRYRFLVGYGYFILLPILLLVWRWVQEVPTPEDLSWWGTVWPFLCLAIIFFVLEVISLIATRGSEHQGLPAIKDGLFLVLFAIALLIAIPEGG